MDESWKKKLLQNRDSMCVAPLKNTLCYRRRRSPRTNGNHFKFLGFYYIKGNFGISKILKDNFVFAQECRGAGRKMWGCRKKLPGCKVILYHFGPWPSRALRLSANPLKKPDKFSLHLHSFFGFFFLHPHVFLPAPPKF